MSDSDIRAALFEALAAEGLVQLGLLNSTSNSASAFVVEELPIRGGFVRADVAIVGASAFQIYEIKSDRDRLDRLPEQIRAYSTVADFVTIVAGWSHAAEILRLAPRWVEVWLAERTPSGSISFVPMRARRRNPELQACGLASLLSRDEALALLTEIGAAVGFRSKPSVALHQRIGEALLNMAGLEPELALKLLRRLVHDYLFQRDRQAAPALLRCDA